MRCKKYILLAAALLVPLVGCQVRQTREAEAPEIEVKGGQLPAYDVDTAEVVISTTPRDITIPDVDINIKSRETTVRVPNVEVIPPDENRKDSDESEDPNR